MGRVYQQTVIDTYSKVGFAKLYTRKTRLTAADILNDRQIKLLLLQASPHHTTRSRAARITPR